MDGYVANDTVSLDNGATMAVTKFPFILALDQMGIDSWYDGIMGFTLNQNASAGAGPILMDYLLSEGIISQKIFAFYLANSTIQSSVEIGGYSTSLMRN